MTSESPKPIEPAKTEAAKTEPAKPVEPAKTEAAKTEPAKTEPAKSAESSSNLPKSAEEAGKWLAESEKFVRLVAENLRYGSWSKRFAIVGGVAFFALNPGSAGKIGEMVGVKELPSGYPTAFWLGMGGLGVAAVGTAMLTLPKRKPDDPALMQERQAIKGLRSFELKDAEIFTQLQRQRDVQECFDAVRDAGLRFGVLMGESGCGKSSLLQAGLLPRLRGESAPLLGVYVKLSDRDPVALIRSELKLEAGSPEEFVPMLVAAVTQAGKPIVLILDQFEQFFVQAKREEDRAGFIGALKAWYDSDVAVKVVVGIRGDLSDRLVEIQKALGYSLGPNQVYRLEKFNPAQATAVLKVIATTEGLEFDERFVMQVAQDELASREEGLISPVDVQILAWMISRESEDEKRAFDKTAFLKFGGVDGLLGRFVQRMLATLVIRSQREGALKVLLELTDLERNVRAGALSLAELQEKLRGTVLPSEVEECVAWLARSDVRLVTAVERETTVGYELAHERLIPALRQVASRELSEADRANLLLDRRVNEWLGNGRSSRYLFSLGELRLLRQQGAYLVWGARRVQKEQLLRRSWRRVYGGVGVLAIGLVGLAAGGGWWSSEAGVLQRSRWQLAELSQQVSDFSAVNMVQPLTMDGSEAQAQQVVREAIQESGEKVRALFQIGAVAKSMNDRGKVKQLLKQSLSISRSIKDEEAKASAIYTIVEVSGKSNDSEEAKELLEQSLSIIKSFKEEDSKARALTTIIEASGKLKNIERAKELLGQSLSITKSLKGENFKASGFREIAEAYIKLKDEKSAKQLLGQAFTLTQSIKKESSKAYALAAIAEAYIKLKDEESAKRLLDQAFILTQSIKKESSKAFVLVAIAEAYIELKDERNTKRLLDQTLTLIKSIDEDEGSRDFTLRQIAGSSVKLKDGESARQLLSQILTLIKLSNSEYSKVYAIGEVAEVFIKLKNKESAKQLLEQALAVARSFKKESLKATALGSIAKASGKLSDSKKAKQLLEQALSMARSFDEESSKAEALGAIAEAYRKLNDIPQTEALLKEAKPLAENSRNSEALKSVATTYTELGNFGEAHHLAQLCTSDDKLTVLAHILRVHAEQQHPEFKQLRDKKEEED